MNSITLAGHAGRDPEVRYNASGSCVANLTLAVKSRREDDPDWFNLEIWGKTAQVAADYVRKGSLIGVTGAMTLDKWVDSSTGEDKERWKVKVDRLQLLGPRVDREGSAQAQPSAASVRRAPAPARRADPAPEEADDFIPF